MKILQVIDSLDPRRGGAVPVVYNLSICLAAMGHQVTILTTARQPARNLCGPNVTIVTIASVTTSLVTIRREIEAADVVHLHGLWDLILAASSIICRRQGKQYIITPHGLLDPWALQQRAIKKALYTHLIARSMLEAAVLVLALTKDEATHIKEQLHKATDVVVLPNGIPEALVARAETAERQRSEGPTVLFMGRITHKKGLDLLFPAFRMVLEEIPTARLRIVGACSASEQADLQKQATRAGIARQTSIDLFMEPSDKYRALADADVFVLPSRSEGFSVAVLEALALGVPVVISHHCHFAEVEMQGAGFIVDLHPTTIASGILKIISDPQLAAAMGNRGRDFIAGGFTWNSIAARLSHLLASLGNLREHATLTGPEHGTS